MIYYNCDPFYLFRRKNDISFMLSGGQILYGASGAKSVDVRPKPTEKNSKNKQKNKNKRTSNEKIAGFSFINKNWTNLIAKAYNGSLTEEQLKIVENAYYDAKSENNQKIIDKCWKLMNYDSSAKLLIECLLAYTKGDINKGNNLYSQIKNNKFIMAEPKFNKAIKAINNERNKNRKSAAKPAAEPAAKPAAEPAAKPTESAAKPTEPAAKPTESATKPTESAAKPKRMILNLNNVNKLINTINTTNNPKDLYDIKETYSNVPNYTKHGIDKVLLKRLKFLDNDFFKRIENAPNSIKEELVNTYLDLFPNGLHEGQVSDYLKDFMAKKIAKELEEKEKDPELQKTKERERTKKEWEKENPGYAYLSNNYDNLVLMATNSYDPYDINAALERLKLLMIEDLEDNVSLNTMVDKYSLFDFFGNKELQDRASNIISNKNLEAQPYYYSYSDITSALNKVSEVNDILELRTMKDIYSTSYLYESSGLKKSIEEKEKEFDESAFKSIQNVKGKYQKQLIKEYKENFPNGSHTKEVENIENTVHHNPVIKFLFGTKRHPWYTYLPITNPVSENESFSESGLLTHWNMNPWSTFNKYPTAARIAMTGGLLGGLFYGAPKLIGSSIRAVGDTTVESAGEFMEGLKGDSTTSNTITSDTTTVATPDRVVIEVPDTITVATPDRVELNDSLRNDSVINIVKLMLERYNANQNK